MEEVGVVLDSNGVVVCEIDQETLDQCNGIILPWGWIFREISQND